MSAVRSLLLCLVAVPLVAAVDRDDFEKTCASLKAKIECESLQENFAFCGWQNNKCELLRDPKCSDFRCGKGGCGGAQGIAKACEKAGCSWSDSTDQCSGSIDLDGLAAAVATWLIIIIVVLVLCAVCTIGITVWCCCFAGAAAAKAAQSPANQQALHSPYHAQA